MPESLATWGRPLKLEERLVPGAALVCSLALHALAFVGCGLVHTPGATVPPRLRARSAEFALMIPSPGETPTGVTEGREATAGPVSPPRAIQHESIERESVEGELTTTRSPGQLRPPEPELTRSAGDPRLRRVERVAVSRLERTEGSDSRRTEGGVRSARLLSGQGRPRYPPVCRQRGIEGEGEYLLAVDETGRVTEVRVLTSAGHPGFDSSVRLFFRRARYEPATLEGVPVPFTLRQKVSFELERE